MTSLPITFFFFQAEDGIRDYKVTGVQTCAMPTSPPGLSITEATKLLQVQDKMLRKFPEVETVFGTVGRGTTSTDNTPMGMVNPTGTLKPRGEWRPRVGAREARGGCGRTRRV